MNITWIKPKHMVSNRNAVTILPVLTENFFLFMSGLKLTVSDYTNPVAFPVNH